MQFELQFFGKAFLCGLFLALLYDGIRLFRHLICHGKRAVAAEDLLYWLACGVLIFRMLYRENSGAVRGFAIAAVVLGMLLYLQFIQLLNKIRKKLHNSVKWLIIKCNLSKRRKEPWPRKPDVR